MRRAWRCFFQGPFWNRGMAHVSGYPASPSVAPPALVTSLPKLQGQCPSRTMVTGGKPMVKRVAVASCLCSTRVSEVAKWDVHDLHGLRGTFKSVRAPKRMSGVIGGRYRPAGVCLRYAPRGRQAGCAGGERRQASVAPVDGGWCSDAVPLLKGSSSY